MSIDKIVRENFTLSSQTRKLHIKYDGGSPRYPIRREYIYDVWVSLTPPYNYTHSIAIADRAAVIAFPIINTCLGSISYAYPSRPCAPCLMSGARSVERGPAGQLLHSEAAALSTGADDSAGATRRALWASRGN